MYTYMYIHLIFIDSAQTNQPIESSQIKQFKAIAKRTRLKQHALVTPMVAHAWGQNINDINDMNDMKNKA